MSTTDRLDSRGLDERSESVHRRLGVVGASAIGAGSWAVAFGIGLAGVPKDWWQWRDDAVITLSHARNFMEFGSIGVSPGGDRVEGFSSPLQFLLSSVFFGLTHGGYGTFLDLQVAVCVLLSGALTALIVLRSAPLAGLSDRARFLASGLLALLVAAIVVSSWTALGWLVSGMENPLFLVIGLALALMTLAHAPSRWRPVSIGFLIAFLGVTRVELPVLLVPLLIACVLAVAPSTSLAMLRQNAAVVRIIGIPVAVWGVVHLARYAYFGSILPNTALAQGRATGLNQLLTLAAMTGLFGVWAWAMTRPRNRTTRYAVLASAVTFSALLVWKNALKYLVPGSGAAVPLTLIALVVLIGIGLTAIRRQARRTAPSDLVFAGLLFVPVAQFLVMGPARLEAFRVFSLALPFAAVWLATVIFRLWATATISSEGSDSNRRQGTVALVLLASTLVAVCVGPLIDPSRSLPWNITSAPTILAVSDALRIDHFENAALPIVANPDLGKISFAKDAVMVDLGWIGDPLLTRISKKRPDLEVAYLNAIATPDVVEVHEYWSCRYQTWIDSEGFKTNYVLSEANWGETSFAPDPKCPLGGRFAIWTRTGSELEYALTRKIATATDPISTISDAVSECAVSRGNDLRCQPVRRAVTRNSPMLQQRGLLTEASAAFSASPTFAMDQALVSRDRGWADRAFNAFEDIADRDFGA